MRNNLSENADILAELDEDLAAWAMEILQDAKGAWLIPHTYSMKRTLDLMWLDSRCEKGWAKGQNAYRAKQVLEAQQ